MNDKTDSYRIVDLPLARQAIVSFLDLFLGKHCMFGLLEVDVTLARQFIEAYKAHTGEQLSFTGYLTYCLAQAVAEDKSVQAYRKGRKQLVILEDVDVGLMVERQIGKTHAPIGYVIRRANHKSFMEIHHEIRAIQTGPAPQRKDIPARFRFMLRLPGPLPRMLNSVIRYAIHQNPARTWVPMAGTVGVTAVGMFGKGPGWGVALDGYSLWLIVGGITRKPAVVQDRIEPRQVLCLTVAFDHDVVDGAPAARFTRRLVELIESGYGLADEQSMVAVGFQSPLVMT